MSVFTFHLVKTSFKSSIFTLFFPPKVKKVPGLLHAECMVAMTLGSPLFSFERLLIRKLVVFAQWENEVAIDDFLRQNRTGQLLAKGWHTRLAFLRQWGHIDEFVVPAENNSNDPKKPVVSVTLARMKMFQVPRFIRWGRPVEKLVRDHPATTLALAATRLPKTVSTFSIWKTQTEMVKMVHGKSKVSDPKRHADAMKERERKDFHTQFTTLRFQPISEHGEWEGLKNIIPGLNTKASQFK